MKSLLAIVLIGAVCTPCIWDSDTLDTELRGLPDAFDLVVGRWHRHSDAYYEDRIAKLAEQSPLQLADYDDLAVAYEYLGKRDQAIEVMGRKQAALLATPDEEHQYRYHANLGTFHAHQGNFDKALAELRKAVAINPDAHFGRERFQIELIEYVADARKDSEVWRRRSFLRHAGYRLPMHIGADGLAIDEYRGSEDWRRDWAGERTLDWDKAHKAVAGMLRFGGLEGPELYRALGELYLSKQHLNLAWWAFGHAIERGHPAAELLEAGQKSIEKHWDDARPHDRTGHVNPTAADYEKKRAEANRWLAKFQEAEAAAIARGDDVRGDAVLEKLLAIADDEVPPDVPEPEGIGWRVPLILGCAGAFLLLFALRARASRS